MAITRNINRLIDAVLKDILHVYRSDETISSADKLTALYAIQDRLAGWCDQIQIPIISTETFALISGTASYTIGQTGSPTLNTPRPEKIVGGYVRQGDFDYPVEIITESNYANLTDKTTAGRPTKLYPKYTAPNITIYLYPVPDTTDSIYLRLVKPYTEPTTYTTDTFVTMGLPGYIYNALKWRLAIDLAPAFMAKLTPEVMFNANDSYNFMMAKNLSQNMKAAEIEMAYGKKALYSLADFFAGE